MSELYAPRYGTPIAGWHRWFAWRPVETIDMGWRWLVPVWRRRIAKYPALDGGPDFWFQHARHIWPTPTKGNAR